MPLALSLLISLGLSLSGIWGSFGDDIPASVAPAGPSERATVLFVYDGDTVLVRVASTTERVRYIGIDAPERAFDEHETSECFAEEAYEANRTRTLGEEVLLVRDNRDRDTYGRLLRYVLLDGESVGEQLVHGGYARAMPIPPDLAHAERLARVERSARDADVGLWSACPG